MSDTSSTGAGSGRNPARRYDVVVVGAGQAGLAVGYFLARQGLDFVILEAADQPAEAWRGRWDSLRLFTPASYSSLPGHPFPGDPDRYPGRDEVVDYLTAYASRFRLPVRTASRVSAVSRDDVGYLVRAGDHTYRADQVVVATGPFQEPLVPGIAEALDPRVVQLHSTGYRRPADLPEGTVLVVGGGNTGFQIAAELAATREVHLSVGSRQTPLPQRLLGRDLFWYLEATGVIGKSTDTRIGRRLSGRDTLIGSSPRALRRQGVHLHGRAVAVDGPTVQLYPDETLTPSAVIWATGFRTDHSWIDVPVFDGKGDVVHRRGVTESPGLYFLGLSWLHTRGSALLGWVKDDAQYLAGRIDSHRRQAGPAAPSTPRTA